MAVSNETKILSLNRRSERLMGWSEEEMVGRNLGYFLSIPFGLQEEGPAISTGLPEAWFARIQTREGREKSVEVRALTFSNRWEGFRLLCLEELGREGHSLRCAPSLATGLPAFRTLWPAEGQASTLDRRCQEIAEEVGERLRFPTVGLELLDERRRSLEIVGWRGINREPRKRRTTLLEQSMSGFVMKSGRMVALTFRSGHFNAEDEPLLSEASRTFVCCPLRSDRRIVGALTLVHEEVVHLEPGFKLWLRGLADCIGQSLTAYRS
jgi:hypothetical protein